MNQVKKFIRKNPLAFAGILIWIVFIIFALFAPAIATCDPLAQDLTSRNMGPNAAHFFGTDSLGRDVFSRVVYGARISVPSGILLAMALASIMGKSMMNAVLAIALVSWPKYARMMRSMVLVVRESEYVTSERAIGYSTISVPKSKGFLSGNFEKTLSKGEGGRAKGPDGCGAAKAETRDPPPQILHWGRSGEGNGALFDNRT